MAVRLDKQDSIGHIVLDRPPANSYDKGFMEELDAAIEEARGDDTVKAIVVRSANERFFSAGAPVSVLARRSRGPHKASFRPSDHATRKAGRSPEKFFPALKR